MIQYVLLDHDGTLFDTEPVALPSLIERFNSLYALQLKLAGKGLLDMEVFRREFHGLARGKLCEALAAHYGFAVDMPLLYHGREAFIAAYYATLPNGVRMAPNLLPALRELHGHGLKFAVVSNNPVARSIAAMRHADDAVLGAELFGLVGPNFWEAGDVQKPDPDVYRRAMAALGVTHEACVAIEDSVAGAQSALAAGIVVLGYTGLAPHAKAQEEALLAVGCRAVFADYDQLPELVRRLS